MSIPLDQFTKSGHAISDPRFSNTQQKIADALDKLKDGALITSVELADLVNIPLTYLGHTRNMRRLSAYRYKQSATLVWWGNKKTIRDYPIALEEDRRERSGDNNK